MGSQMELLALATLHEFQNSLVFQSVFHSPSTLPWVVRVVAGRAAGVGAPRRKRKVKWKVNFHTKRRDFHHFFKVSTSEWCESEAGNKTLWLFAFLLSPHTELLSRSCHRLRNYLETTWLEGWNNYQSSPTLFCCLRSTEWKGKNIKKIRASIFEGCDPWNASA